MSNRLTDLNLSNMRMRSRMFRTDVVRRPRVVSDRCGIQAVLAVRLARSARIGDLPISYDGRTRGEGKKIDWRDGVAGLWYNVRFNLFPPRPNER